MSVAEGLVILVAYVDWWVSISSPTIWWFHSSSLRVVIMVYTVQILSEVGCVWRCWIYLLLDLVMTTAYTIPDVKPQEKKQCWESGFIWEGNISSVVISSFCTAFFLHLFLLTSSCRYFRWGTVCVCVCVCVVCLYDMSLGSVLLGYYYRFPSTEISEHFLVHVVIII